MSGKYRLLEKGEIIQEGDEVDACNDGWRDAPKWVPALSIGQPAPDPAYPSHRIYRRPLKEGSEPKQPGFYWALWLTPAPDTHEGKDLAPAPNWGVVEVWENFLGDPCEADADEKFGVSVPGVRETQWLRNFLWGDGPLVNVTTDEQ